MDCNRIGLEIQFLRLKNWISQGQLRIWSKMSLKILNFLNIDFVYLNPLRNSIYQLSFIALLSCNSGIFVYIFVVPVGITNRTAARDYCAIHTPWTKNWQNETNVSKISTIVLINTKDYQSMKDQVHRSNIRNNLNSFFYLK